MADKLNWTDGDRALINTAVGDAESRADVEIVPVVAEVSGRYDRAEDICGLWCGMLLLVITWCMLPASSTEPGSWQYWGSLWHPVWLVISVAVGFVAGAVVASYWSAMRHLFIPQSQLHDEVQAAARRVFFDQRVHHTRAAAGALLYLSICERRAVVLVDRLILEQFGQPHVDRWCQDLTERLKTGGVVDALCETIRTMGNEMAERIPAASGKTNELPDALVVLERA